MPATTGPGAGADPPAAVYFYSPDRRAERPASHLTTSKASFRSTAIPAASSGLATAAISSWRRAGATRGRKFYEVHQATSSPIAAEALRLIAELYAIETTIRLPDGCRTGRSVRQSKSLPMVAADE